MRRYLFPLIVGLGGCAFLVSLGIWQLNRLDEKLAYLAGIEARIGDVPAAVPAMPDPSTDQYAPVVASGAFTGSALRVIVSHHDEGAGYRVVSAFRLEDGRLVMVDEGYIGLDAAVPGAAEGVSVTGNLHWPDEVDRWTPAPDVSNGLFYARDVGQMAQALGTEPLLIVAREVAPPRALPMPVTTDGIPNDHLGYAIQWFGLAAVWLGMTAFLLWRTRKRTV